MDTASYAPNCPNVLFLFADDLQADAIGAYGNGYIRTPIWTASSRMGTRSGEPTTWALAAWVLVGLLAEGTGRALPHGQLPADGISSLTDMLRSPDAETKHPFNVHGTLADSVTAAENAADSVGMGAVSADATPDHRAYRGEVGNMRLDRHCPMTYYSGSKLLRKDHRILP